MWGGGTFLGVEGGKWASKTFLLSSVRVGNNFNETGNKLRLAPSCKSPRYDTAATEIIIRKASIRAVNAKDNYNIMSTSGDCVVKLEMRNYHDPLKYFDFYLQPGHILRNLHLVYCPRGK